MILVSYEDKKMKTIGKNLSLCMNKQSYPNSNYLATYRLIRHIYQKLNLTKDSFLPCYTSGYYLTKVKKLKDSNKITDGKCNELLAQAYREDLI